MIMNYIKLYENIVNKYKLIRVSEYTETHHIIPRCAGGTDDDDNLVELPPRFHYFCHYLLTKMDLYQNARDKLIYAFWAMSNQTSKRYDNLKITSRMYAYAKTMYVGTMIGRSLSDDTKSKISKSHKELWTDEKRKEKSKKMLDLYENNPEIKTKLSNSHKLFYMNGGVNPNQGKHHSLEVRQIISDKNKGKTLSSDHVHALRSGHSEYMANNKEEFSQKVKDSYTDERRENQRQMTLQHWQDPEYRAKVIANSKAAYTDERREQNSIQLKERWKDPEYRAKFSNSLKAHYETMTDEEYQAMCQSRKDQVTDETRQKLSELGKKHSATTHAKIICEHCNAEVSKPNYSKYHGDKCKVLTGVDFKPEKTPCKYCGKLCAPALLNRWHNENCKHKESIT